MYKYFNFNYCYKQRYYKTTLIHINDIKIRKLFGKQSSSEIYIKTIVLKC